MSCRVDVVDLKALMLKKIGIESFKRYFYCLERFISEKMGKSEFDKSCLRVLGKENLPLHNQMIKAILKNACSGKAPPRVSHCRPVNGAVLVGKSSTAMEDGHMHDGFVVHNQNSSAPVWSNGVVLPMSPRKVRPGARDRIFRDRPSPLGPNGKIDSSSHLSMGTEDSGPRTVHDGGILPCDYRMPIQQLKGLAEQPEIAEKLRLKNSYDIPVSSLDKDMNNLRVMEYGEEVEQAGDLKISKGPLIAPLGIPFCSASVGGTQKSLPLIRSNNFISSADSGVLPDSEILQQHMEQIAATCGLAGGVTMDCANSLNKMLDVYMRRLIKSCVQLAGESSTNDQLKSQGQVRGKFMNGLWPSNNLQMQSVAGLIMEEEKNQRSVSLQDFKAAMDLKPQQLGEDWPLLMEKISMRTFEE